MLYASVLATEPPALNLWTVLVLGFFLGMRHATDSDHVVAVSTIVSRERRVRSAALVGALWGAGHTLTIVAVGIGIILFTLVIPPRLGLSMELSVGLMLVLLGVSNLHSVRTACNSAGSSSQVEAQALHDARDLRVAHLHPHNEGEKTVRALDRLLGTWTMYQWLRPLVVGLVHGLAGSAAVALLVLTTLHSQSAAVAYLVVFGIGTIVGMMTITMAMASALRYAGARSKLIDRKLSMATGFLSVAFGLFIVYQMGFVRGLFTSHPSWTPQ